MWLLSNQISAHFKLKRTFRNLSLFSGFGTSKLFIAHAHTKAHIKEPTESVPSSKLIIRCAVWTSNHRKKIKDDKKEFQFSNDLCNLSLSYTTHQTAESRYKKLCTHTPVWDQERVKKISVNLLISLAAVLRLHLNFDFKQSNHLGFIRYTVYSTLFSCNYQCKATQPHRSFCCSLVPCHPESSRIIRNWNTYNSFERQQQLTTFGMLYKL